MVEDDEIGMSGSKSAGDLLQFAQADECCRIWTVATLNEFARDFRSGRRCQFTELVHAFFETDPVNPTIFVHERGGPSRQNRTWGEIYVAIIPRAMTKLHSY